MYTLKEFLVKVCGLREEQIPSATIFSGPTNRESTLLTNTMQDYLDCFSFTLIKKGECTLLYKNEKVRLKKDDLYIYMPAHSVEIIDISADYEGMCLFVDKSIMFENSISHNVIKAAYFPVMNLRAPKIHLDSKTVYRVNGEMTEIAFFLNSDRKLKTEASQLIFSLMLVDLVEFLGSSGLYHHNSPKEETIVMDFLKLVSKYYMSQHNVGFYAEQLGISSIYLSRVVKSNTGKTVMAHINDILAKEAVWLLNSTDKSIKEIAAELNFADQASFNKFFNRLRGMSPSTFRNSHKKTR